ncbi:NAD(+) diphosphatase [Haliangium sp.]|uniref:NAD(+) diphosphatase n=1 Tax=Haliangium sp. TaxID=2663208 RepID=UPI003D0F8B36
MSPPELFADAGLDRLAHRRGDSAWLAEALASPANRLVLVWRHKLLLAGPGEARLAEVPAPAHAELAAPDCPPVLLGEVDGTVYFGLDLGHLDQLDQLQAGSFADLRRLLMAWARVADAPEVRRDAHLMAYAQALLSWHRQHRFCGACGAATRVELAGHLRRCPDCAHEHYPTAATAILALVHDDRDRVVLGRSARHPPGMRSILAGFREPGESLEDTVAREVFEEVGLTVTDIRYHGSQPWPFPGSLMVGFSARATATEIRVDTEELEEAAWYDRDQVRAMVEADDIRVPPRTSLSGRLLRDWLADELDRRD